MRDLLSLILRHRGDGDGLDIKFVENFPLRHRKHGSRGVLAVVDSVNWILRNRLALHDGEGGLSHGRRGLGTVPTFAPRPYADTLNSYHLTASS